MLDLAPTIVGVAFLACATVIVITAIKKYSAAQALNVVLGITTVLGTGLGSILTSRFEAEKRQSEQTLGAHIESLEGTAEARRDPLAEDDRTEMLKDLAECKKELDTLRARAGLAKDKHMAQVLKNARNDKGTQKAQEGLLMCTTMVDTVEQILGS
jgi:hypothetical protein